ncbi:MAG TPA: hypothetical protein VN726_21690 [Hanamia sp.]|nr:hypothetical protein [Hanamia sp.]
MNRIFLILLVIFLSNIFEINAQVNKPDSSINAQPKMADLLLKKSKNQKTAAWILLGAGAGAAIAGTIIGTNAVGNYDPNDPFNIFPRGTLAGGAFILGGAAAMVASVPFFIASGRNKKKANLIFRNESKSFSGQLHHKANFFSVGIMWKLK